MDPNLEWPDWTDKLGNKYKAGDNVAYATLWGRSAHLTFGKVVRINKCNSKGEPHEIISLDMGDPWLKQEYDDIGRLYVPWGDPKYDAWRRDLDNANKAWTASRVRQATPTATVTILANGAGKPSTVKNLHNIIKIP